MRIIPFLLLLAAFACTRSTEETTVERTTAKYGIIIFSGDEDDEEYFLPTNSLSEGNLVIPEKSEKIYSLVSTYKDGYYYGIDDGKPKFTRYIPTENGLVTDVEMPFHHADWNAFESWYNWLDDKTIFLGSTVDGHHFSYNIIDVKSMKLTASGRLDLPKPAKGLYYCGVTGQYRDHQLYVSYTHHSGWQSKQPCNDTTFLAVIDYPSMKTVAISKDTRSTSPGGLYLFAPFSFMDQKQDIYLMAAPGGRTHRHPTATTGIFRVKKDEKALDKDYFFPVADKAKEEGYLLYPLGQGKALMKMVPKTRIKQYMDYLERGVADYYVLDLEKKTKTKLDLPADGLSFTENVLVEDGKAYIGINENKNESWIWEYDIATGNLKKGLKVGGKVLIITRL